MVYTVTKTQTGETDKTQELGALEGLGNDSGFYYESYFLKSVLIEELGDSICSEYNALVVAVHAVFLESGFVGFDSELGLRNDRLYIMEEGPSKALTMSLRYTLPELLDSEDGADSVVLKFQSLGHFVNVYGTLANGGSEFYWLCLDEYKIGPIINLLRLNCSEKNGWCSEKRFFDFQKIVKDELALPLLADLCHKSGLVLQSCFPNLPPDLKLKIFELLPGNDLARVECVCSEMRLTLSSKNDLWKQKFVEEFWVGEGTKGIINWKQRFASYWETRKKRKRDVAPWKNSNRVRTSTYFSSGIYPQRHRFQNIFRRWEMRMSRLKHRLNGMEAMLLPPTKYSCCRTDEFQASSDEYSLQSIGIASGDRVYFSLNPIDSACTTAIFSTSGNSHDRLMSDQSLNFQETQFQLQSGIRVSDMIDAVTKTQIGETVKPQGLGSLEGEGNDNRFYYELCFLKRVLKEELDDNVCSEYNVLVVAIHAILLESGLIGFDSELGLRNDRLYIMEEGPCKAFTVSVCYTLPQLLDKEDAADWIVLRFQRLGHFVNVYGTLANGGPDFYWLCLDEYMIAPFINLLRLNCGEKDGWCSENQFFEFQKIVKDGLVLPLLTDLCHKTGLVL